MNAVSVNPYATIPCVDKAPFMAQLSGQYETQGMWRQGNLLVLTKGMELPNICLKTNEPTDVQRIQQRFSWTPGWALAVVGISFLVFPGLGLLLCLILGPFVTQRAKVRYPASANLYRRWKLAHRIAMNATLVGAAAFVSSFVALAYDMRQVAGILILLAMVVIMVGLVSKSAIGWRFKAKRVSKNYVWLKGVHPAYLQRLPEMPVFE